MSFFLIFVGILMCNFCLVNKLFIFFNIKLIMFIRFFLFNVLNLIILLKWLRNLGVKKLFNWFKMDLVIFLWVVLKLMLVFIVFVLVLFVMIMMVFLKLIVWFCVFVKWLLLRICKNMCKILGCVFLILFNKIKL